ncbi:MAG: glucosamine-6-phosphate deaminase [Eubacteriales bacterium]|nr:glucosamine-6-phosphate deaminase [Eubacteriales bacterium]
MKIIYTENYEVMSAVTAQLIAAQIYRKPDCVLGLATGSTPLGTYAELIRMHRSQNLNFSKVRTVNLDEYKGLSPDSDQSYAYFMRENFFRHINIRPENTHVPNGLNPDEDAACSCYERLIDDLGGIDLQLLGIGHNGHIGFNEPDDTFIMDTHAESLTEKTVRMNARFFERIEDVPTRAYTMGIGQIMAAKTVILIANGADKAETMARFAERTIDPHFQGSILHAHRNAYVIADKAALSILIKQAPQLISNR